MGGWESFFVAEVGASAALAGLVFVGVSLNLTNIMAYPWLPGRALEAIVVLAVVLLASSVALVPAQRAAFVGAEILAVGLAGWAAVTALQARAARAEGAFVGWYLIMRLVLGQVATLSFVIAGVSMLIRGYGALYWVVPGVVFCFLVALSDAWVLLIEINR